MEKSLSKNSLDVSGNFSSLIHRFALSKFAVPLLLIAITAPLLLWNLATFPIPWFDEGVKANLIRTVAERDIYATYSTDGYQYFDNSATNGPVDTLAMALVMKFFGTGLVQGRVVTVLFTWVALIALYQIAIFMYGRRAVWFSILVLLAVPSIASMSLLFLGRQVLSEVPALAMISVGLALWISNWRANGSVKREIFAGLVMGLGLLTKTQNIFSLLPAITIMAGLLVWQKRATLVRAFLPIVVTGGTVAGWMLIGYLATSPEIRQANAEFTRQAVSILLLTDLFGRGMDRSSLFIFVTMLVVGIATVVPLLRPSKLAKRQVRHEAQMMVALIVIFHALWFGLLSVGWVRYAFLGWVFALVLLGRLIWRGALQLRRWMQRANLASAHYVVPTMYAGLVALGIIVNTRYLMQMSTDNSAQQMADYIRANVPADAVIETWDWQVDVLSGHWAFHHPDEVYEFDIDRRMFWNESVPDRPYDILQANPDYVLIGPYSGWTEIYDRTVDQYFTKKETIGPYALYARVR